MEFYCVYLSKVTKLLQGTNVFSTHSPNEITKRLGQRQTFHLPLEDHPHRKRKLAHGTQALSTKHH